jgi:hypothetical protein
MVESMDGQPPILLSHLAEMSRSRKLGRLAFQDTTQSTTDAV